MNFESGLCRIGPLAFIRARGFGERLKLLRIEGRIRRRADRVFAVREWRPGRIRGRSSKKLPAGRLLAVELDRLGEIVDARPLLVGPVTLFAHPEEIRRHESGERLAILLLGNRAELLAEFLEAWIGDRRRRADRHRLIRFGGCRLLLLRWRGLSALGRAALTARGRK